MIHDPFASSSGPSTSGTSTRSSRCSTRRSSCTPARGLRKGVEAARLWATRAPGGVQQTIELEQLYEDGTEGGGGRAVALIVRRWHWDEDGEPAGEDEMAWVFELRDRPILSWRPYEDRAEALRAAGFGPTGSLRRMADAAPDRSRSRRASPLSASSCPCSRTTFDPAALEAEAERLEAEMRQPGFWDDQETAARTSAAHARAQRRLEIFRGLESDVADLDDLAEMAAEDEEMAAELGAAAGLGRAAPGRARGGAPVQRRVRRRRRRRHRPRRRRRHRLPGLGRDPAADVPALGRAARLRGRDEGGLAGGGGRASSRRPSSPAARTPTASSPPSAASTGWSGSRPSTPPRAATPASPRSTSGRWSTPASRSRSTTPTCASTPTAPPAPAASTSTRPTRRCGSPTSRPASSSSARTSARRPRTRRWRCSCCARS